MDLGIPTDGGRRQRPTRQPQKLAERGAASLVLALLAACGGGGGSTQGPSEPVAVPSPPWTWGEILKAEPDRVRMMALGDSITVGVGAPGGYRLPLFITLTSENINSIEFVGSQTNNWPISLPLTYHEGHSGWTLADILDYPGDDKSPASTIESLLDGADPSLILLHAGTNDSFEGETWQAAPQRLGELLDRIHAWEPTTTVLVARVIPSGDPATNLCLDWINDRAEEVVYARAQQGQNVQLVRMDDAVGEFASGDGSLVHPDLFTYIKMGTAWRAALSDLQSPVTPPVAVDPFVDGVVGLASSVLEGHLPDLATLGIGLSGGLHEAESNTELGWRSEAFLQDVGPNGTGVPTGTPPTFELRAPAPVDVVGFAVWNGWVIEQGGGVFQSIENARRVGVETSTDGVNWVDRGELELAPAPARALSPPEEFDVDWPGTLEVRLTVLETWNEPAEGETSFTRPVALGEVRLRAAPSQP